MRRIGCKAMLAAAFVVTAAMPWHGVWASDEMPQEEAVFGCVLRQTAGRMKFVEIDPIDKAAFRHAAAGGDRTPAVLAADPCLTGQVGRVPAGLYAALARKHPDRFEPLPARRLAARSHPATSVRTGALPQYRYVSLGDEVPPEFLFFDAVTITNSDRVYGTAYRLESDDTVVGQVAVFERGSMRIAQEGFVTSANGSGTSGGWVFTDPEDFLRQAALFRDAGTELIPRLAGEIDSAVLRLNDRGVALVFAVDEEFNVSFFLYHNGRRSPPLDFGPDVGDPFFLDINNQGEISGTTFIGERLAYRGFRHDAHTGTTFLLEPVPTEPHAWAMGINDRGDILGYSFFSSGTERIGVWDRGGDFHTYFVQGTPEFPTISNSLRFNDRNQIVITSVSNPPAERNDSYLVPRPGERVNLADLVEGVPAEHGRLARIRAINNSGNMVGFALTAEFFAFDFLLERTARRPAR